MIIGKLAQDILVDYSDPLLSEISFTTNAVVGNDDFGELNVTTPSNKMVIKINDEEMYVSKTEISDTDGTFLNIIRGYRNTNFGKHKIGDLIYKLPDVIIKKYDSHNIYDILCTDEGIVMNGSDLSLVRGFDAIVQNIRLALQSAGNEILNFSQSDVDENIIRSRYQQIINNNGYIVDNIEIENISKNPDDLNRLDVSMRVTIGNQVSNVIQIPIFSDTRVL